MLKDESQAVSSMRGTLVPLETHAQPQPTAEPKSFAPVKPSVSFSEQSLQLREEAKNDRGFRSTTGDSAKKGEEM